MTGRANVKLIGFAPDLDISLPGVILDGSNFIPTRNGISAAKTLVGAGIDALASDCRGIVAARKLDDSRRVIAGTQTTLEEAAGTSWNDVSKGGGYTGGVENRWRFTQFGNETIATNKVDPVQVSESGNFDDLGGSPPKASIVETCQGFVMLFDYEDGGNNYPDGWWCSALRNSASWSPSIATQAANGRLLDTPGPIRAGKRLGNIMTAYKERSLYLGFNDGPPVIWRWELVPGDVGCVSQEAIQEVLINNAPMHIFAGFDGFYIFDGTRPRFIGNPLKKWFNSNVSAQYRYRIQSLHDPLTQNVYFYLVDAAGTRNFGVAYNYLSDRWGYLGSIPAVEAAIQYLSPGITYDGLGDYYDTYDDLPTDIPFDSPFWTSGAPVPAVFTDDHMLRAYTGTPGNATITCGYTGNDGMYQTLTRVRPRFNAQPDSGSLTVYHTPDLGDDNPDSMAATALSASKHDIMVSSKWFAPSFTYSGDFEMTGYSLILEEDGEE